MGLVTESFEATPMTANQGLIVKKVGGNFGGFLATASGTLAAYDGQDTSGTAIVTGLAVTAGNFTPIPATFNTGLFIQLSSSAAGTAFAA